MNAPQILDVLVPRVELLKPQPGDVVTVSISRPMPDQQMTELALNLRRLFLEHGKSVIVAVLPPGMTIETLDDAMMLRLGRVRALPE